MKLLEEDLLPFDIDMGVNSFGYEEVRELSGSSFDRWMLSEND
jgi:hypothetical protein